MSKYLETKFFDYIKSNKEEDVCSTLGCYPSHIKRWVKGSHKPSLDFVSEYVEKVILPGIQSQFNKRLADEVNKAMAEFTGQPVKKVSEVAPAPTVPDKTTATPEPAPTVPDRPRPAPVENVVEKDAIKYLDWLVKNPTAVSDATLMKLRDLYYPLGGRNISVLFPCYKTTNPATAWALLAMALDLGKEKIRFDMELGDALIYHSRCKLATRFLDTGAEWSLWIDDDIIPPIGRPAWFKHIGSLKPNYPDNFASKHVIHRLLSHNKTLVGGLYFARQQNGNAMFAEGRVNQSDDRRARAQVEALQRTGWVATGCMLVHRSVYLDIQKKFPDLAPAGKRKFWNFFLPTDQQGEDAAFCTRAKEAGHDSFVDLGLECLHVGHACYAGHNTTPKFE